MFANLEHRFATGRNFAPPPLKTFGNLRRRFWLSYIGLGGRWVEARPPQHRVFGGRETLAWGALFSVHLGKGSWTVSLCSDFYGFHCGS